MFSFHLLVGTGYLVDITGYLVVTSGYLIATAGYVWLLLVTSDSSFQYQRFITHKCFNLFSLPKSLDICDNNFLIKTDFFWRIGGTSASFSSFGICSVEEFIIFSYGW